MKIIRRIGFALIALSLISAIQLPAAGAAEKTPGVQLGSLVCKSQPGTRVQIFLKTSVAIKCTFKISIKGEERYKGEIGFLGIDLSKKSEETLNFTVIGLTTNVKIGDHSLEGDYSGASVSVGLKEGLGSTQFVGGLKKAFSLVPSLDTFKGTGISAGVSRMKLMADK